MIEVIAFLLVTVNDARRACANYFAGAPAYLQTANGMTLVYCFKLSHVKVGDVILYDVETLVQEKTICRLS